MPVDYKFVDRVDLPSWVQLPWFQGGTSNPGTSSVSDGSRYIYYAIQVGSSTSGTASTTQLWQYDTKTGGWRNMVTLTSGNNGIDIDYDPIRNILIIIIGVGLTEWRFFNLNAASITFLGQTVAAWSLSIAITPVLPATANTGSSILHHQEIDVPGASVTGAPAGPFMTGVVGGSAAPTTTVIRGDVAPASEVNAALIGCNLRYTSGVNVGVSRSITGIATTLVSGVAPDNPAAAFSTITTNAFGSAPGIGDTFVIELPQGTATAGAVGTLTDANKSWLVNLFTNADVLIVSGTGAGQRRRIASNTATILTLAGAVAGNPRTGNFSVAPDATSVYQIIPSSDFYYFAPANGGTGLWKLDVMATSLAWVSLTAWTAAPAGGSDVHAGREMAPFSLFGLRGGGTATVYRYDVGLNAWVTLGTFWGAEVLNTGASSTAIIPGRRRLAMHINSAQRLYYFNIAWGFLEPLPSLPYSTPSGNDGKRLRYMKTPTGVEWLYYLRAGGAEYFRMALEWS